MGFPGQETKFENFQKSAYSLDLEHPRSTLTLMITRQERLKLASRLKLKKVQSL